jgi:hypothetical protein
VEQFSVPHHSLSVMVLLCIGFSPVFGDRSALFDEGEAIRSKTRPRPLCQRILHASDWIELVADKRTRGLARTFRYDGFHAENAARLRSLAKLYRFALS